MPYELLFTSAQRGLKPGSQGYCTVAQTAGIPPLLAAQLEQLSTYAHHFPPGHPQSALNPIVHACLGLRIQDRTWRVLSRICDAGADYSGRTNYFCRHLALEPNEWSLAAGGPLALLTLPGWFDAPWDGVVRELPPPRLPAAPARGPAPCLLWERTVGEPGYAGLVVEAVLKRRQVNLLFSPGQDVASLLREAFDLLPAEQKMQATFSTYAAANLPPSADCLVRCFVVGSNAATNAQRNAQALTLDLTRRLPPLGDQPGAAEARRGDYLGLPPAPAARGLGGPAPGLAPAALGPPTYAPQLQPAARGLDAPGPALAAPAPVAASYDPVPYPQTPEPVAATAYVVPRSAPPAWMGVLTHGTVGLAGCALGALAMALLFPEGLRPRPVAPPAATAPEVARVDGHRPSAHRPPEPDREPEPERPRPEPTRSRNPPRRSETPPQEPPEVPPPPRNTVPEVPPVPLPDQPPRMPDPPVDPKQPPVDPKQPPDERPPTPAPTPEGTAPSAKPDKPPKNSGPKFEERTTDKRLAFDEGGAGIGPAEEIPLAVVPGRKEDKFTVEFASWNELAKVRAVPESPTWEILVGEAKIAEVAVAQVTDDTRQVSWRWPSIRPPLPAGLPNDLSGWGVLVLKNGNRTSVIRFAPPAPLEFPLTSPGLGQNMFEIDPKDWTIELKRKKATEPNAERNFETLRFDTEWKGYRADLAADGADEYAILLTPEFLPVTKPRAAWKYVLERKVHAFRSFGATLPAWSPNATELEVEKAYQAEFKELNDLKLDVRKILRNPNWDEKDLKELEEPLGTLSKKPRKEMNDQERSVLKKLEDARRLADWRKHAAGQRERIENLKRFVGGVKLSIRATREIDLGNGKTAQAYLVPREMNH